MKNFSEVVRERLEELELKPNDLARKINISTSHVFNLLKGQRRFNETLESKICEALGIEIVYKFKKLKKGA